MNVDTTNVDTTNAAEIARLQKELLEPFDLGEVKFKPAMVKNNRALALAYIDARHVMDRLDEVVGIAAWKDEYTVLPSGEVECRLSVKLAGEWVTKADVGGQSEQPDEGDRMKAAYSDALKRAAVKFGVGRFLYRSSNAWHDYDPVKKSFAYPLALMPDGRIVPRQQAEQQQKPQPAKPQPAKPAANEASRPQPRQQAEPKDNPQERARAAGALAQAKDEADAKRVLANIAKAIDDGDLGPGDAEALRRLGKETLARFKTPAA